MNNSQQEIRSNNQTTFTKSMDDWLSNSDAYFANNFNNSIHRMSTTTNTNNDPRSHMNNINGNYVSYQRKQLDDWLNTTLKDLPKTSSISSMEFPDGPARSAQLNGNGLMIPPVDLVRTMHKLQTTSFVPVVADSKTQTRCSDFISLPSAANLNDDTIGNSCQNDLISGVDNRRFSDPCLVGNSEDETQIDNRDKIFSKNQSDNNKLLATLIKQINILHETNSRIFRNLNDTKIEIETMKNTPNWDFRNRRDRISGFSTHSQPMGGYTFGTHSPAPTYHSGVYTPGMMTDVVREVKEAARIREDALLSRVRALVEERSWTVNETNLKLLRDIEEMKVQITQLKVEKSEMRNHLFKLEEEMVALKQIVSHIMNPLSSIKLGNQMQSSDMLDISSVRHDTSSNRNYDVNSKSDSDLIQPMQQKFIDLLKEENVNQNRTNKHQYIESENRETSLIRMEKNNMELRRELQDTRASKKQADEKIQDLEQRLKVFQDTSMAKSKENVVTISTGHPTSTRLINGNTTEDNAFYRGYIDSSDKMNTETSTISLTGPVTDL